MHRFTYRNMDISINTAVRGEKLERKWSSKADIDQIKITCHKSKICDTLLLLYFLSNNCNWAAIDYALLITAEGDTLCGHKLLPVIQRRSAVPPNWGRGDFSAAVCRSPSLNTLRSSLP